MPDNLAKLLREAKSVRMTPEQQEQQRRSFAYGNSKIENAEITRDSINREADALSLQSKPRK